MEIARSHNATQPLNKYLRSRLVIRGDLATATTEATRSRLRYIRINALEMNKIHHDLANHSDFEYSCQD
jgi:hypothetical protein